MIAFSENEKSLGRIIKVFRFEFIRHVANIGWRKRCAPGRCAAGHSFIFVLMNQRRRVFSVFLIGMVWLASSPQLMSQTDRERYIETHKDMAIAEMRQYGIPASITLAQGILESGNGKSRLAVAARNHFGIKCHTDWDGERVYHDDDRADECFRKYDKVEDSFRDHSLFLADRGRYAFLFELAMDDYRAWAKGLQKAGYATNKKYADLLIRIIEDNRLYRFDEVSDRQLSDPHEIRRHAVGLRFIQAVKGDTWESLAAELDMSVDRLLKYNECSYDRGLLPGMFVFLQKKKRRSTRADYRVQEGDDMYLISQKMGIRLKYLYQRNNLAVGAQPAVGQPLILR